MSDSRIPTPAPRPTRRSALALWIISCGGIVLAGLVTLLVPALGRLHPQARQLVYGLLAYVPFIVLPVFLVTRREAGMWRSLRPYPVSFFSALVIVSLAVVCVFFMSDLTALWTIALEAIGLHPGSPGIDVPASTGGMMLYIFYMAILPGVCEELLFRGAMLSSFERCGTRHAIYFSTALFALSHGSFTGLPAHLLLGAILGTLVVCCDSIYAGCIFHTAYNAATVILVAVAARSGEAAAETGRMLDAVGGAAGVVALLGEMLLSGAMICFAMRMFRATARLRGVAVHPRRREPLRGGERAMLFVGLLFAAVLYLADIFL